MRLLSVVLAGGVALAGCGDDGNPVQPDASVDAPPDGTPDAPAPVMASAMIGPMGGMITVPGVIAIEVPPDSVDANTMITIAESTVAPPAGAITPVYTFGPSGLVFAHPIEVRFALPAGVTSGDVYWSKPAGMTGFDNIGGAIDNGEVVAHVVHFSDGHVGPSAATRTVTGSQKIAWTSASAFQLETVDLTSATVAALVDDGDGGYTTINGVGHADGTFTIDNVPDGAYLLRVPGANGAVTYVRTMTSAVDAGYVKRGRPGTTLATAGTNLALDLTNLATWQDGDRIDLLGSESNTYYFVAEQTATSGVPVAGDTQLTDFTMDLTNALAGVPNAIDGSRTPPDRLAVAQLSQRVTTNSVPYIAMTRLYEPAPFTPTPGQTTTLSGAFTDVVANNTVSFDVRVSSLTASRNEETRACFQPPAFTPSWAVMIFGAPGGLAHGLGGITADFLSLPVTPFGANDVVGTDMGYGTPLQGTWGIYGRAEMAEPCFFTPPGATTRARVPGHGFQIDEPIATLAGGPIDVRLGQVRLPTLNGSSVFTTQTGFGTTPTLAWTAPAIGTPSIYVVGVYRLFANPDSTGARTLVAELMTTETSIKLPAGILTAGDTYVFKIDARKNAVADPSAINRQELPFYRSGIVSVMHTP